MSVLAADPKGWLDSSGDEITVEREEWWSSESPTVTVTITRAANGELAEALCVDLTPAQAREVAAHLVKCADELEMADVLPAAEVGP